jgi:galactokinase
MQRDANGHASPEAGVRREFERRFGAKPALVTRAPGRVNLIGDHTDYNDGFVLPMAIDRAVWIALRPRTDGRVELHSLDFGETAGFTLDDPSLRSGQARAHGEGWLEYVRGVAWALGDAGLETGRGWEGVVAGDVPLGAGLSSSAALELASARAFAGLAQLPWEPARMAKLAQRAENAWVGVNCGIMDQLISAAGREGHALLIDCRSLGTRSVPIPANAAVVVLDTATRRGLVDSAYNERRAQCEAAARFFGVPALRDVTVEAFERRAPELDELTRRRARHVVTEDARVLAAADALAAGDVAAVGRLMDASHASLRDDFEVSSKELDAMVEIARAGRGCHGARMTGAGFGGCAVALVAASAADDFATDTARRYEAATGKRPAVYVCSASGGASLEPV